MKVQRLTELEAMALAVALRDQRWVCTASRQWDGSWFVSVTARQTEPELPSGGPTLGYQGGPMSILDKDYL